MMELYKASNIAVNRAERMHKMRLMHWLEELVYNQITDDDDMPLDYIYSRIAEIIENIGYDNCMEFLDSTLFENESLELKIIIRDMKVSVENMVSIGSSVKYIPTGKMYKVVRLWEFARDILVTPDIDFQWDMTGIEEDFWDCIDKFYIKISDSKYVDIRSFNPTDVEE